MGKGFLCEVVKMFCNYIVMTVVQVCEHTTNPGTVTFERITACELHGICVYGTRSRSQFFFNVI